MKYQPYPPPIVTTPILNTWEIYPDILPNQRFRGLEDREEQTLLRGAFVLGQNVKFRQTGQPNLREGYSPIGTEASNALPVQRAWVYETRGGDIFEIKAYSTFLYYWLVGSSTDWTLLQSGFTAAQEFCYGNIAATSDATGYTYYCNGVEDWYRWSGANSTLLSATAATITKPSGTWTADGFTATGNVVINGTVYNYTGGAGTATLTGVTPSPAAEAVGSIVVQAPENQNATMGSVIGSVGTAHDGRLHARLESKKSVWNYSKLDDPSVWTVGANDGDGGSRNVEFGAGITAFGKLNKTLLAFKKRIIKTLSFQQFGSRVDVPFYQTLTSADDKSTTLGALTQRGTFSTPYGLVFVTPDKQMMLLTGITANGEPQYIVLSDPIQPLFSKGDHTDGAGICVDNNIYYSFRSSPAAEANDTVLVGDLTRRTNDAEGQTIPIKWDTPYVGWYAKDWTAVKDDSGNAEVHFHSSLNSSTYKVDSTIKSDNGSAYTAIVRTWAETFGVPHQRKKIDYAFVDIRMKENTILTATILYDEDGFSGTQQWTLNGSQTQFRYYSPSYNPFGASPFGEQKIGSNGENSDMGEYRFFLETTGDVWFFNVSLQLSGQEEGGDFELIRFGLRISDLEDVPQLTLLLG